MVAINPAASILPIVEAWRRNAWKRSSGRRSPSCRMTTACDTRVAESPIFLARYDPQVADVFLKQAVASQNGSRWYFPMRLGPRRVLTLAAPWPCRSAASRVRSASMANRSDQSSSRRADHLPGRTNRGTLEGRLAPLGHPDRRTKIPLNLDSIAGSDCRCVSMAGSDCGRVFFFFFFHFVEKV